MQYVAEEEVALRGQGHWAVRARGQAGGAGGLFLRALIFGSNVRYGQGLYCDKDIATRSRLRTHPHLRHRRTRSLTLTHSLGKGRMIFLIGFLKNVEGATSGV